MRCELPSPNARELFVPFLGATSLLISLMDHTRASASGTTSNAGAPREATAVRRSSAPGAARPTRRPQPGLIVDYHAALATHDDTTVEQVDHAVELGARMSEFPTTIEAAQRARDRGLATVAGAPNVVRGGSHSGNVNATDLARRRLLNGLSSDYVPGSLLRAAWLLMHDEGFAPSEAIELVTSGPARAAGLLDRGAIAIGQRADLVRVGEVRAAPVVREVWRSQRRVA